MVTFFAILITGAYAWQDQDIANAQDMEDIFYIALVTAQAHLDELVFGSAGALVVAMVRLWSRNASCGAASTSPARRTRLCSGTRRGETADQARR